MGGCHGEEKRRDLQDRGGRRRQRKVMGGRGPRCGRNGSRHAARPARGGSDADGYEGGQRQGFCVSHPRVAVLQIRSVRRHHAISPACIAARKRDERAAGGESARQVGSRRAERSTIAGLGRAYPLSCCGNPNSGKIRCVAAAGPAHSSNRDSGGAGLRWAGPAGKVTPTCRITSSGCRTGGTRSGANRHAASNAATAATTSVMKIAYACQRLRRRRTTAVVLSVA